MNKIKQLSLILTFSISLIACGNSNKSENTTTNTAKENVEQQKPAQVKNLVQKDLAKIMEDKNVVVIDVRTEGEVASGFIKGTHYFININSSDFETKIKGLDKSKTYVMYCRSGGRSGRAASYMVKNGFNTVYNLQGGMMSYRGAVAKP